MRIIVVVFGILITLAGIVWGLQGLGVIPGSFMSNNPSWIWIGGAAAPLCPAPLALGRPFRPPAQSPRPPPPPPPHQRGGSIIPRAPLGRRSPGRQRGGRRPPR